MGCGKKATYEEEQEQLWKERLERLKKLKLETIALAIDSAYDDLTRLQDGAPTMTLGNHSRLQHALDELKALR